MTEQTTDVTDTETADRILARGRETLRIEADGLTALYDQLDEHFVQAVQLVLNSAGRVIVTGMGKSGHIGRKIAATLASTGTPAYFVHPGEASHGDLGMISPDDVVLALSNSGTSPELADIITYCRRCAVPLIALTARPGSQLGQAATVVLKTADVAEACPLAVAPTTSTTQALALGDALAMALLEQRGFTSSQFGLFHPGGKLGAQLKTVAEVVADRQHPLPLTGTQTGLPDTISAMTAGRLGCVGVTDAEGALAGIVTDGDLRRSLAEGVTADLLAASAGQIMTADPLTITPDALAVDALTLMTARKVTALFVCAEGSRVPAGILHLHDLLDIQAA